MISNTNSFLSQASWKSSCFCVFPSELGVMAVAYLDSWHFHSDPFSMTSSMLMNVVLLNCTDFSCYSSKPTYQNWCAGTLDTVTASNIACCSDGPNQDNSFFVINTTYRIKGIHSYSCAFLLCLIETTRAAAGIDLWSGR